MRQKDPPPDPLIARLIPSYSDTTSDSGVRLQCPIDEDFKSVLKGVSREIQAEFDRPDDEPLRASLVAFFSLFEMLRRGWTVTRSSPPSHLKRFVEVLGWQELTIVYKGNVERLLASIIQSLERDGCRFDDPQRKRIVDHARRIHYLKYLEEGEERVIRSHFDRFMRRIPKPLFAVSLICAVAAIASGYIAAGVAFALVAYGVLAIWGMLWRSFDVELRTLSQRILGGLEIEECYRTPLIRRLLRLYQEAEIEGRGAGSAGWLRDVATRGPSAMSIPSSPRWLTEVVRGHLITAAALAASPDELSLLFEFVRARIDCVDRLTREERILLFGVLASLADRVSARKRDRAFRNEYSNWLGDCFRLLGLQESRRHLGGAFVDAVTRFGRYQEFMTERLGLALHHGSRGLWDEFDAYVRHAGHHASPAVLAELLRVAETVRPCREGCCYSDGLSRDRIILYPERRHALYKALWIVYLNLKERDKVRFGHRMRRFLDRAALDVNARIACDILQKMAQVGYLSSPSIVELLAGRGGSSDPEVRVAARSLRQAYDCGAGGTID